MTFKAFIVPVFTGIVFNVVIAARILMLQILFAQQLVRFFLRHDILTRISPRFTRDFKNNLFKLNLQQ